MAKVRWGGGGGEVPYSSYNGHKTQLSQGEFGDGGNLIEWDTIWLTLTTMEAKKKSRCTHVQSIICNTVIFCIGYVCSLQND